MIISILEYTAPRSMLNCPLFGLGYIFTLLVNANSSISDRIKLVPYLPDGLDSVKVTFLSPRGKIVSQWQ